MKKVLITGATGFIGSHLLNQLLKRGEAIRVLALPEDMKALEYEKAGIEVVYGNIADSEAVDKALRDIHTVYHLAAVVSDWAPKQLYKIINVKATENICRYALRNRVEKFVYVSTNDVFGLREDAAIDESFPYSRWGEPYPDSKLEASEIVWRYHRRGLSASVIYPCWVYGPGDTTFLLPLIDAVRKNKLVYWRKDSLIWPAYIDNVIDLLIELGSNPRAVGQGFLVHDGISDTFENFVARIAVSLNLKPPRVYVPYSLAFTVAIVMQNIWRSLSIKSRPLLTTYIVKNLGSRWKFSIKKARTVLGWDPEVRYDDGLSQTIEWLKGYLTCSEPEVASAGSI